MKLKLTAFVSGVSGKTGDAVGSNWKGIPYARRRVIPRNPNTTDQQAQRARMAHMGPWWRSLPEDLQLLINLIVKAQALSGFNALSKISLDDLFAGDPPRLVPGNPAIHALGSVADTLTPDPGKVQVLVTGGAASEANWAVPLTCPVQAIPADPDAWTVQTAEIKTIPSLLQTGILDLPVITEGSVYNVVLLVIDAATIATATAVSGGIACEATAGIT